MSQNISWLGANYTGVPFVTLPKTGGGTARFDDASVTTAAASDVTSGKIFVAADGTVTTGTNSGGGGTYQAKTNISPTTSSQTITPDNGYDALSSVQINAMPSGTAGNSSVSLTASVTTKAAATITPGTTAQEIAAGTYLTGKQTIAGDSNLVGSRIVAPYSIFGVAGTAQLPVIVQDSTTHGLSIS